MAKGKSCPLKGYKLVWSDEFKGSTLDESKWTWQKSRAGWVNNELQTYVKGITPQGAQTALVSDGTLKIRALAEGDKVYSARIYGNRQEGFEYGYIVESEIRTINGKKRRFQKKTPITYVLAPEADNNGGGGNG